MSQTTFRSNSAVDGAPGYRERSGETVTVMGAVAPDADPAHDEDDVATIYRVRFEDGVETEAFEDELDPVPEPETAGD